MKKCFFCGGRFSLDPTVTAFPIHSFVSPYIPVLFFPPDPTAVNFIDAFYWRVRQGLLVLHFKEREEDDTVST